MRGMINTDCVTCLLTLCRNLTQNNMNFGQVSVVTIGETILSNYIKLSSMFSTGVTHGGLIDRELTQNNIEYVIQFLIGQA